MKLGNAKLAHPLLQGEGGIGAKMRGTQLQKTRMNIARAKLPRLQAQAAALSAARSKPGDGFPWLLAEHAGNLRSPCGGFLPRSSKERA